MDKTKGQNQQEPEAANPWFSDLKVKRDEYNTEIRKKKREDELKKIRNSNLDIDKKVKVGGVSTLSGTLDSADNSELKRSIQEWFKYPYKIEEFLDLIRGINSDDRFKQHFGAIGLRTLLSKEEDCPIQHAIDNNAIPRLLQFTQLENEPHLQLEAAWSLTNIVSGTKKQAQAVIDEGGVPYLINLLKSQKPEIVEQGIWALGNIAGDSNVSKLIVLENGGLEALVEIVSNTTNQELIKHGIWSLSNLCRGKKLENWEIVNKALPIFTHALQTTTDTAIIIDSIWALAYLSEGNGQQIQTVLETGILPVVVNLIKNPNLSILVPALRTIGNFTSEEDEYITVVLQMPGIVECLFELLNHHKKVVKKEVFWILSNMTAGNEYHIEAVLGTPACLEKMISISLTSSTDIIREAAWILTNAVNRCNLDQMVKMGQLGILDCFCDLLVNSEDPKVLEVVLDGINNILRHGDRIAERTESENPYLEALAEKGMVAKIEALQTHPSLEVYQAALKLLEKHFDLEDL